MAERDPVHDPAHGDELYLGVAGGPVRVLGADDGGVSWLGLPGSSAVGQRRATPLGLWRRSARRVVHRDLKPANAPKPDPDPLLAGNASPNVRKGEVRHAARVAGERPVLEVVQRVLCAWALGGA